MGLTSPTNHFRRSADVLLASLVLLTAASFANRATGQSSDDVPSGEEPAGRVWVAPPSDTESPWYPRGIEIRRGRITAFDAQQLRLIPEGGEAEVVVAAQRVLWIEPGKRSPQERSALKAFQDRRYGESLRPLIDVLESRPPVWRQQWVLMAAAQAAWRGSRSAVSLELVSQLDQRPLPPLVLAWLPVSWRSEQPTEATRAAAEQRLSDPSPAVRLVAASWLLSSAERRHAKRVLGELVADDQRRWIARLAEAVLWRAALPDEVIQSADRWESKIDSLPLVLQVGPAITLLEKLKASGAPGGAAKRWRLSLQLTPPHPHPDLPLTTEAAD